MAETLIPVPQIATPSVGGNVDASNYVSTDGVNAGQTVLRERVVIGDPTNYGSLLDIDLMIRTRRQMDEVTMLESMELATNGMVLRDERRFATDRRGNTGRGTIR